MNEEIVKTCFGEAMKSISTAAGYDEEENRNADYEEDLKTNNDSLEGIRKNKTNMKLKRGIRNKHTEMEELQKTVDEEAIDMSKVMAADPPPQPGFEAPIGEGSSGTNDSLASTVPPVIYTMALAVESVPIPTSIAENTCRNEADEVVQVTKRVSRPKRPTNPEMKGLRARKCCNVSGCEKWARKESKCQAHGAKGLRRYCSHSGCTNWPKRGGVCQQHGAQPPRCKILKCRKERKKGGVCVYHGAQEAKLSGLKCPKRAIKGPYAQHQG